MVDLGQRGSQQDGQPNVSAAPIFLSLGSVTKVAMRTQSNEDDSFTHRSNLSRVIILEIEERRPPE